MDTGNLPKDGSGKAVTIVDYDPIEERLKELRERYGNVTFDVATSEGMKALKSSRKNLRDLRIKLENLRKEKKAPLIEQSKLLDSEAKRITDLIRELEDPIDQKIKEEEQRVAREKEEAERKEKERIEGIRRKIADLQELPGKLVLAHPDFIREHLQDLTSAGIAEDDFQELTDEAVAVAANTINQLEKLLADAEKREADKLELERFRAMADEAEKKQALAKAAEKAAAPDESVQTKPATFTAPTAQPTPVLDGGELKLFLETKSGTAGIVCNGTVVADEVRDILEAAGCYTVSSAKVIWAAPDRLSSPAAE